MTKYDSAFKTSAVADSPTNCCHSDSNALFNRKKPTAIIIAISVLTLFMLIAQYPAMGMDHKEFPTNCDLHNTVCVQNLNNHKISLSAEPKPVTAMQDITFKVTLPGDLPIPSDTPYIHLDMPGMHMGLNRVGLEPTAPGEYQGNGVIVRCKSGKKVWRATVTVPDLGEAQFVFDVVY